jgi:short-subunit dehydrogenase
MEIKDKVVVIIGATGGIGRVMSLAFGLKGAKLVLVGRDKNILTSLINKLKEKNVNASAFALDVTEPKDVAKLARVLKKFGRIDVLVHAAGIGVYKRFEKVTYEEWLKSLDVNVNSVFLTFQKLLPLLRKSEKSYCLVTGSGMGKVAVARRSAYCASKFALRGLVLTLAKEFKDTNINFIHLTLGSVLTSFGPLTLDEKEKKVESGKGYLKPSYLAHAVITKLENSTLETETAIYPPNYYTESKKGKT